jgi:hypothetical protein
MVKSLILHALMLLYHIIIIIIIIIMTMHIYII